MEKRLFLAILVGGLAGGAAHSAGAAPSLVWEPLREPGCGGAIVSLSVSPHDAAHLVSGGDMLGTAVSFDGGENWRPGLGLPSYEMASVTFHPMKTNVVWIGSCMGPFVSTDGGRSWESRRRGMPPPSRGRYTAIVEKILVDTDTPGRLLAFGGSSRRWSRCGTTGAVWASDNDGGDWRRVGTLTKDGFTTNGVEGVNIIKAWKGADGRYHAFADEAGWFISSDRGKTWVRRQVEGIPTHLASVTTHPIETGIVWAVAAPRNAEGCLLPGGLYRSTDGGRTFQPGDGGIRKTADANPNLMSHFEDIEISPLPPHWMYVSDMSWHSTAIWVSDDGGRSWRKGADRKSIATACFAGPGCRLAASPADARTAYAYNSEYVLKTVDGGRTWTDMTALRPDVAKPDNWRGRGWNGWCSKAIVFNPYRRGQSVVQMMDAGRGWISDDGLQSWHYANGEASPWLGGVSAAFSRDGSVYLTTGQFGANNGVAVSRDGGTTWRVRQGAAHGLPEADAGEYGGVWADPDRGCRAFVILKDGLYRTEDGGETWKKDETAATTGDFAEDPTHPGRFYVRNAQGVFETDDWRDFRPLGLPGESDGRIACDGRGRVLVCRGRTGDATRRGLWRYDPRTKEWTRLHGETLACAVAADPSDPARIILTTADNPYHDFAGGHGVWISADDGTTWARANDGLHVRRLTCVAFDPFDPELVVAGTGGGGFVRARWPKNRIEQP